MTTPHELAVRLAREAGQLVEYGRERPKSVERKSRVNLVTETDRASEKLITDGIREAFPAHAIVAEEATEQRSAAGPSGPCWVVDPLDGTTNFVHGLPHCAISIAYIENGIPQAAAVYDPAKNEMFEAAAGAGAWLNGRPIQTSLEPSLADALLVTGFPYDRQLRLEHYLRYFGRFLVESRDLRRYGSAALDLCWVAAGRFDGFFEWGLAPWDTAAGWLVVEEAGGRLSDFDGGGFDPWQPTVLATNGGIHARCLEILAELGGTDLGGAKPGGNGAQ